MDRSPADITTNEYLIFSRHGALLAINARLATEITQLPEITWIAETPPCIPGVINLRGRVIPIMDTDICFNLSHQRYQLTDTIVVIGKTGTQLGVIANAVRDVVSIPAKDIEPARFHNREKFRHPHLVMGAAMVGEDLVMILDPDKLMDFGAHVPETPEDFSDADGDGRVSDENGPVREFCEHEYFCPEATPEERAVFHKRALTLMQPEFEENFAGKIPIAVVGLNREYFGMAIEHVLEFSDVKNLTPIPCTPDYILGNMNLRGNILTLIDVRQLLNMAFTGLSPMARIVITSADGSLAGVAVDDVFDVVYLNPADIVAVPVAVKTVSEKYILGTASYRDKTLTILDMKKILRNETVVINEEV